MLESMPRADFGLGQVHFNFNRDITVPPLYPFLIGVVNLLGGGPHDWSGTLYFPPWQGPLWCRFAGVLGVPGLVPRAGLYWPFLVAIDGVQLVLLEDRAYRRVIHFPLLWPG